MSLQVLIAEDEEDIGSQYSLVLKALGHKVYLTKDGEECLRKYRGFLGNNSPPFDVVVIDYFMPIKDGISVANEILKMCPEQRIIFVSGHGPKLLSGLKDFEDKIEILVKPIPLTALISIIENRRQKEIVKNLYSKLKKWDGSDGLSVPVGHSRAADRLNVSPD